MKKLINFLSVALFLFLATSLYAQNSVVGKWRTFDEETKKPRSIVEIYERDGKVYGKIVKLLYTEDQTLVCDKCEGARKNQKMVGLEILTGMKKHGDHYSGGEICKPSTGKTYHCKIWLENGKLMVRGYVGFLYKTQEWIREN